MHLLSSSATLRRRNTKISILAETHICCASYTNKISLTNQITIHHSTVICILSLYSLCHHWPVRPQFSIFEIMFGVLILKMLKNVSLMSSSNTLISLWWELVGAACHICTCAQMYLVLVDNLQSYKKSPMARGIAVWDWIKPIVQQASSVAAF